MTSQIGSNGAAPVFRFFDTGSGTHFYSVSVAERDSILLDRPDLVPEGVAFYERQQEQSGDVPVFRFFDTTSGTHLFTSSSSERASILATRPDLHDEGIAFFAPGVGTT